MQLNEPNIRKAQFLPVEEAGYLIYPVLKNKTKTTTKSNGLLMDSGTSHLEPTSGCANACVCVCVCVYVCVCVSVCTRVWEICAYLTTRFS